MNHTCQRCGLLIDCSGASGNLLCPHCGTQFKSPESPPIFRVSPRRKPKASNSGSVVALIGTGLLLALCGGGFALCSGAVDQSDTNYGRADDSATQYDAKLYAREAVRLQLKWKDDADFPGGEQVYSITGKPRYFRVIGKVRAVNGFGAKLTQDYIAEVRLHDVKAREWRYHYVNLGGDVVYVSR